MVEFLIVILIVILAPAAIICFDSVKGFKFPMLSKACCNQSTGPSVQTDPNIFNCRVQPRGAKKDNCALDAFIVEIFGSIHAPSGMHNATVQILITDITEGIVKAKPVHSVVKQYQILDSRVFCYKADLGKLPEAESTLSDWTCVAQLRLDWLMLARKGKRDLQFSTSILSSQSGAEFACATCTFTYENTAFGYIDLQENIQRTRTLAVALALSVSAADNRLYDCEVELIKNWARGNIDVAQASKRARRRLDKALEQAVNFFHEGNQLDTYKICKEVVEIAPVASRYDILELCLRVAQANGAASAEELTLLKNLAGWLEVDMSRFSEMMAKILPANMHDVKDIGVILGVTSDMGKEDTRQHLNKEYRKWNARVTNFNSEIRTQADYMLKLIAQARSAYIG